MWLAPTTDLPKIFPTDAEGLDCGPRGPLSSIAMACTNSGCDAFATGA